eukprot:NODE_2983_length_2111_cov_2.050907.p1 GENE.NODE_2983_length_2111_cov_2.050907~~NODE_2983_length_2111_cov_2.050907.p1  ORF type:complete len:628 (-),score=179.43 NODE_2983_length_2111_cov_2.050907:97-1980(-)
MPPSAEDFEVIDDSSDGGGEGAGAGAGGARSCSSGDAFAVVGDSSDDESPGDGSATATATVASKATAAANVPRGRCDHCGTQAALRRCGRCRTATYCSSECQRHAWAAGHRHECSSGGSGGGSGGGAGTPAASIRPDPRAQEALPSSGSDRSLEETIAALEREAEVWRPPAGADAARHWFIAKLHTEKLLAALLEAHAAAEWTEHHTSGLLDTRDLELPAGSGVLRERLHTRLFFSALGECIEHEGANPAAACGAYARVALVSNGWVEAYHRWAECLCAARREGEVPAVHALALRRGVWKHVVQRPNDLYVPCLHAQAVWDAAIVPAAQVLEEAFPTILGEFHALRADAERGLWTPVFDQPLVEAGAWTDFKLVENGKSHPVNCARCPETVRLLAERCPEVFTLIHGSIIFSRLAGGTVIKPHCGPTNARIRIHLALEVPDPPPRIRIAGKWYTWEVGRCLVFDDSFEHEVMHNGGDARVVLIVDLWHPEFTDQLRRRYLHGRHRRRYKAAQAALNARDVSLFEQHIVDPVEVRFLEGALRSLSEVREAAVTVHLSEDLRQTLVAYIESATHGLTPSAVCELCSARLVPYGLPTVVLAVVDWPRAIDGQVDRKNLPPPPSALLNGDA